jgi:hypothetical protein
MDGATDAASTHVVGIGMRTDRAVGIAAVIVTVEIAAAVTVARAIVVALIGVKDASGQMAAVDAVVIAMEIGGHAAIDPAARKRKGIVARVRHGAMEVGATATVATGIAATPIGRMATGLMPDVLKVAVATAATAAMEIVRRVDVLTATVTAIASIATPTVEATPLARTPPNRLKAFVRMRQGIVPSNRRRHWPAARVMLA